MMPYLVSIGSSCFCTYIATYKRRSRYSYSFWSFLAIVIPCILAGARDMTVGTDISTYGQPVFLYAVRSNSLSDMFMRWSMEPLYLCLIYAVSRFTNHIFWSLFFVELVCVFFTYEAVVNNDLGKWSWLGMLTFYLTIYGFSLNIMRQSMAMAICFYAFKYIKSNDFKRYFLCIVFAMGFHRTALIALIIYPIYIINARNAMKRNTMMARFFYHYRVLFNIGLIIGSCVAVLFARQIILLTYNITGLFHGQVTRITSSFDFNITDLLVKGFMLMLMLFASRELLRRDKDYNFYIVVFIIGIILMQVSGANTQAGRVALYFSYYLILIVPRTIQDMKSRGNRIVFAGMFIVALLAYFYMGFVVLNWGHVYPYTSQLLKIS